MDAFAARFDSGAAQGIAKLVSVTAANGGCLERCAQIGNGVWVEIWCCRGPVEGHHTRENSTWRLLSEGVNVRLKSCAVKAVGARLAAVDSVRTGAVCFIGSGALVSHPPIMVLILSADAVAAALLGALIETLGYSVRFARPPETTDQTLRRVRPSVCLLDCDDPENCSDEFLGRAAMRGISVVVFGKRDALDHVRALAVAHEIDVLAVPSETAVVDDTLRRAMKRAG